MLNEIDSFTRHAPIVKLLLKSGALVTARNGGRGRTALNEAME